MLNCTVHRLLFVCLDGEVKIVLTPLRNVASVRCRCTRSHTFNIINVDMLNAFVVLLLFFFGESFWIRPVYCNLIHRLKFSFFFTLSHTLCISLYIYELYSFIFHSPFILFTIDVDPHLTLDMCIYFCE